jgi:hypothetical protein
MRMLRRTLTTVVAAAVMTATQVVAPMGMANACAETVALKTFHLTVKGQKKVYKVGDTAKIVVTVTRPAHEDPAGAGIYQEPPESFPAENVNAGVGLRVGDVFLFGHAMTDAEGKAVVDVKLESWTPSGSAIADAFSWNIQLDTPCLRVEENGYMQKRDVFKVVKL